MQTIRGELSSSSLVFYSSRKHDREGFLSSADLKAGFSGAAPPSMAPDAYLQGNIRLTLEEPELWKTFHDIGTEMIITKPGR